MTRPMSTLVSTMRARRLRGEGARKRLTTCGARRCESRDSNPDGFPHQILRADNRRATHPRQSSERGRVGHENTRLWRAESTNPSTSLVRALTFELAVWA